MTYTVTFKHERSDTLQSVTVNAMSESDAILRARRSTASLNFGNAELVAVRPV